MPASDPAFTAASCFILWPVPWAVCFWVFTLFLWLDYIIPHLRVKSILLASECEKIFTLFFGYFVFQIGGV
ncbi:hypothetical protein HMPREF1545_03503 [Oscillibacter sp. KLE 1728]|nr:hypothetical protein HMPREF1545_03503 [Oscillibacter sp. KLE 1728]ERK57786.1 hypothetical protein HMPREF1546_03887 [Oscillibacter sp. KLE 1745]